MTDKEMILNTESWPYRLFLPAIHRRSEQDGMIYALDVDNIFERQDRERAVELATWPILAEDNPNMRMEYDSLDALLADWLVN